MNVLFLCTIPLPVQNYVTHNNVIHRSEVWVCLLRGLKGDGVCTSIAATMFFYGPKSMACTLVKIFIAGRFCNVLELSIKAV